MKKQLLDRFFPLALDPGVIEPFMNKGDWAVHDVLPSLLEAIGPADVRVMSYNISEESLRAFSEVEGIRSMKMLLDEGIQRHKIDLLLFASSIASDIRIEHNHAKVLLVENESYAFGIVGSANLNRASRYESGFYFTNGRHYAYFRDSFDHIFDNALPVEV